MHSKLLLLAALAVIGSGAGCCMCDAPYDYCGPTFLGAPGEECVTDARMNSVFTPYPGPPAGHVVHGPPMESVLQQPSSDEAPAMGTPVEAPMNQPLQPAIPPSMTQGPPTRAVSTGR